MFTIGIFSTHLPYLAFVFFYALFFLFGIQKSSGSEPKEREKIIPVEISIGTDNPSLIRETPFDGADTHFYTCRKQKSIFRFDRKAPLFFPLTERAGSSFYCFLLHSRPPPAA